MKKSDAFSYVVYFLILVAAILLGIFVIRPAIQNVSNPGTEATIIITIAVALGEILLYPLIYELMHVLGAKMGKYEIISFCVLYFTFYKTKENKWKFHFKSFDGLTGEVKIKPITGKENPKAMMFLPNLTYALMILVFALLYISQKNGSSILAPIFAMSFTIPTLLLFYNILPIELDCKTDGFQLKLISTPEDKDAYNELLRIEAAQFLGNDVGEIKVYTDKISDFTVQVDLITIYNYLNQEKFYEIGKLCDKILEHKEDVHEKVGILIVAHKLFSLLYTGKIDEAKEFYKNSMTDQERRTLSDAVDLTCIRAYLLVSCFIEESESEVQYATGNADAAYKLVDQEYKEIEAKYYKATLALIKQTKPDWELIVTDEK